MALCGLTLGLKQFPDPVSSFFVAPAPARGEISPCRGVVRVSQMRRPSRKLTSAHSTVKALAAQNKANV